MLNSFWFSFNAVMPMLALLALGRYLHHKGVLQPDVVAQINHFVFHYPLPVTLFLSTYGMAGLDDLPLAFVGTALVTTCLLILLGYGMARLFAQDRSQYGVIIQCAYRSNYTIIGLALVTALCGESGAATMVALQLPGVILFNIAAVTSLTIFSGDPERRPNAREILKNLAKNPLIQALLLGFLCMVVRGWLPLNDAGEPVFLMRRDLPFFYESLSMLGRISSPMLIVCLGAQVEIDPAPGRRKLTALCVALRLVVAPVIGFAALLTAQALGFLTISAPMAATAVAFFAAPCAINSCVMVAEIGGDSVLMRQSTAWSNAISLFTLFLWCAMVHYFWIA